MRYIMCKTQCVLAVVALYVGLAHSWDIAAVSSERINYYTNGTKTHSDNIIHPLKYITTITYDGVNNRIILVNFNTHTLSYDITAKKFESLLPDNDSNDHTLQSIAYDTVEQKLFWLDSIERTIKWVSLKPGANKEENIIATLNVEEPVAIALDSCNGYIYVSCTRYAFRDDKSKSTIQRFRLDGSGSEVILAGLRRPMENSLVVDQYTKKLYWTVKNKYEIFYIESADLDGSNKKTIFNGTLSDPDLLMVSKDSIYWTYEYHDTVQQLSKNPSINEEPKVITIGYRTRIVTNYKLDDKTLNCERLKRQSANNVAKNVNSVCYNYCFRGDCTTSAAGQPKCRCSTGFSGERCEVELCRGYCLNGGRCSIDKNNKPVCQCHPSFSNEQCEIPNFLMKTFVAVRTLKDIISTDMPPLPSTCGKF